MKRFFLLIILIASIISFHSCKQNETRIQKSFYYWKTSLSFSPEELKRLSDLQVEKLYTRFFDVNIRGNPMPVAKINILQLPPGSVEIVPVVFITNKTLTSIEGKQIDSLAGNIANLVGRTASAHGIVYREIQVDCDWTLTTKEKYFSLLRQIKKLLPGKTMGCTIRLHQVKYRSKTGVPPVDRGMLMFYNMGDLQDVNINSIYDERNARKYTATGNTYPLPLDIALPIFGWVKHYRDGKVVGLVDQLAEADLQKDTSFTFTSGHRYTLSREMFYRGEYLKQGDLLIAEEVSPAAAKEAAELVKKYFKTSDCSVALYHWDELNLSRYDNKAIQAIYSVFR